MTSREITDLLVLLIGISAGISLLCFTVYFILRARRLSRDE